MTSIIIILSILLGIFTWGIADFTSQLKPSPFQIFAGVVFIVNTIFLFLFIVIEVHDN